MNKFYQNNFFFKIVKFGLTEHRFLTWNRYEFFLKSHIKSPLTTGHAYWDITGTTCSWEFQLKSESANQLKSDWFSNVFCISGFDWFYSRGIFMSEISIGSVGGPGPALVQAFSWILYSPFCSCSMVADVSVPEKEIMVIWHDLISFDVILISNIIYLFKLTHCLLACFKSFSMLCEMSGYIFFH